MIVFATDGLPTIGEREPKNILKRVDELNTENVRVFVFGEGFNVNTSLLDYLALDHRGESEYILPSGGCLGIKPPS
jgi:Ca-activated chloride channel family protein